MCMTISKLKQWDFCGESFGQGLFAPLSSSPCLSSSSDA